MRQTDIRFDNDDSNITWSSVFISSI